MKADDERILKLLIQALHERSTSATEVAPFLFGALLLAGIVVMLLALRLIWVGGLSKWYGR